MADIFTSVKRSEIMSRVLSRDNKATETALISLLHKYRITGWRRRVNLFGQPDFVFRTHRLAVFVDGCFWHCCPLHGSRPASNTEFWERKLERNKARDRLVTHTLKSRGWSVLRIWQHELRKKNELPCVRRIRRSLHTSMKKRAAALCRRIEL